MVLNRVPGTIDMKIAIAKDGSSVSGHFGHCEGFSLYSDEGGAVRHEGDLVNGQGHGAAVSILVSKGVTHILSGGMGQRARDMLEEQGIISILGVQGALDQAARDFFSGKIVGNAPLCTHSGCAETDEESAGSCTCSCHQEN